MWNAMSECYKKLGKLAEAKKCSERANRFNDKEGIALNKLAKLHLESGDLEAAAACFEMNLQRKRPAENEETAQALHFLAKFAKEKGRYDQAIAYARNLHDYFVQEREEAGALIREITKL